MNKSTNRQFWSWPWGYGESLVLVLALVCGGFVAQWWLGSPPLKLLAWPVNLVLALVLVVFCLLTRFFRTRKVVRFFSSVPFSVILIGSIALFSLAMGLIPQYSPQAVEIPPDLATHIVPRLMSRLGIYRVTSSWPFDCLYFFILIALGTTIVLGFSSKRKIFTLNHLGLWLVLLAAGLGAADRQRVIMRVPEGGLEWRSSQEDEIKELDLAIRLDDFIMEEYPARLTLFDPVLGQSLPSDKKPDFYQIDPRLPVGRLGNYRIEVLDFLPLATPVGQGNFTRAVINGAVQAAQVKVTDLSSGEVFSGWLSAGNGFIPTVTLLLGPGGKEGNHSPVLMMVNPEPKNFLSKVKVFTAQGLELKSEVSVNHPLRVGQWLIYQYDYDSSNGPRSTWSGFELVRDRWLYLAYAGFIILAVGCVGLVIRGRK
ncbi:MAG: cytochrome c biogenesis protein ResB [Deltaproteobacteria bacterium]|jgi:hypothetical protein|nr:cytochrome c biogenesis protein ResB [Deltaproteobacteria bacterium]